MSAHTRKCDHCGASIEHLGRRAEVCGPTCRRARWEARTGKTRSTYPRTRPSVRKRSQRARRASKGPRADYKGAFEQACDAIEMLLAEREIR